MCMKGWQQKNVFETLTNTAEIDVKYGVIFEAFCTLSTEHRFILRILEGNKCPHCSTKRPWATFLANTE